MQMDAKKALTLTETLTAVFFVMEHIRKSGYELSTMGEAAKKFIANWGKRKNTASLSPAKKPEPTKVASPCVRGRRYASVAVRLRCKASEAAGR